MVFQSPSCYCRGTNIAEIAIVASAIMFCFVAQSESADNEYSLWKVDGFKPAPAVVEPIHPSAARQTLSLDGVWEVSVDPGEKGFAEGWYDSDVGSFDERISVPGNWNAQGLGGAGVAVDDGPKWPEFGLRSATIKGSYVGLAWYRHSVDVPADWRGRRVRLVFGGLLSSVRLWVNGQFAGGRWTDGNSFYIDVTRHIKPGQPNLFVMAIDNRWKETATISHFQWYTAAGGPFHHMALESLPLVHINSAIVWPRLFEGERAGIAEVHVRVTNSSDTDQAVRLDVNITSLQRPSGRFSGATSARVGAGQTIDAVVPIKVEPVELWSCETPNLYKMSAVIKGGSFVDDVTERFGMRTVASVGSRFELNGRPTFILGQHFNFFWPNSLTPPITKQDYLKHLGRMKDHGFNYLRTPWLMPEECYQAADELGMMVQLEFPYMFDEYGKIKEPNIKRLIEECLVDYGNHPSLVLLCMSNEGSWDGKGGLNPVFCAYSKSLDPTRLVIDTDGKPETLPASLLGDIVSLDTHLDKDGRTGIWGPYMASLAEQPAVYHLRPCIDHEFLNVPTLPGPRDVDGYGGAVLSPPKEILECRKKISSQGMDADYPLYLKASYRHQANFIKEGIERSRKNPLKAGYSMCAWNDIGAGIHWGLMDQFMNPKGISAEEMRVYNAQSVLLVDFIDPVSRQVELSPDYCRVHGKTFVVQPAVSYFGRQPVSDAALSWRLRAGSGEVLASGRLEGVGLTLYTVTTLPRVVVGPVAGTKPTKAALEMELSGPNVKLSNSWPLWLFPRVDKEDAGRSVVAGKNVAGVLSRVLRDVSADEEVAQDNTATSALWVTDESGLALQWLQAGRDVLFLAKGGARPNPFDPGWFKGDDHCGSVIRRSRLLGDFPHEGHADWQFRNLNDRAANVPEGGISANCVVSSAYGESAPHVQHQLFAAKTEFGGRLTYCLLNVLSGRPEADYMLLQIVRNAARADTDPVMKTGELLKFLGEGE